MRLDHSQLGMTLLPRQIFHWPGTFLVVTTARWVLLASSDATCQARDAAQRPAVLGQPPATETSLTLNVSRANTEKPQVGLRETVVLWAQRAAVSSSGPKLNSLLWEHCVRTPPALRLWRMKQATLFVLHLESSYHTLCSATQGTLVHADNEKWCHSFLPIPSQKIYNCKSDGD